METELEEINKLKKLRALDLPENLFRMHPANSSPITGNAQRPNRPANRLGFCFIEVLSPCPTLYQRRIKWVMGSTPWSFTKNTARC